jgi:hypothetical protein
MIKPFIAVKSLLIIGFTIFLISSCNKNNESPQSDIIGKWTISSATLAAKINGKTISQYYTDVLGLSQTDADQLAQAFDNALQQSFTGTVEVKSDKTYTQIISGSSKSGTWKLSSDSKTLTLDAGTPDEIAYEILTLTKSSLHLKFTTSESQDINSDGTPETITIDVDMTLTK